MIEEKENQNNTKKEENNKKAFWYELLYECKQSGARRGVIHTPHRRYTNTNLHACRYTCNCKKYDRR